jgi:hypothetical protein
MRTGYDSTHVRIFGDVRLYMTIEAHHYQRLEQWSACTVGSSIVDGGSSRTGQRAECSTPARC